jgi:nucleotide-binding universal stress UspA family protein
MAGEIVVGVDGSESSRRAARWAAGEALRSGVPLRLVHCLPSDAPVAVDRFETRAGRDRLGTIATEEVRAVAGDALDVEGTLTRGPAARALVRESRHASLLVIAGRRRGGFATLPGSTSVQVAAAAACPVAVVRVPSLAAAGAPVLVGVDASGVTEPALEFAFARAAAREVGLVALHAWRLPRNVGAYPMEMAGLSLADGDTTARQDLTEMLRPWQTRYPQVAVDQRVVQGNPVACLTEASQEVDVLVVGSRGLSAVSGLRRGSVSQGVLRHAHRPVVIARRYPVPDRRDGAGPPPGRIRSAPAEVPSQRSNR